MTQTVIETDELTKVFGRRCAVDRIGLTVRRGEVYGLLGPNGAGKTTTLRMLLGLVRRTSGRAAVLGQRPGHPAALSRIGMLVETPAFYPYLSARDNLRVFARYAGVPTSAVDRTLRIAGLTDRAGDRTATYSLGMKQRLGVAIALLKDPELLILDEPTNGLDPLGIAEMRQLIASLSDDNHTVLLCSHLLAEVQQLSDRVSVLRDGAVVHEGTVDELCGTGGLALRAQPLEIARTVAERVLGDEQVATADDGLRLQATEDEVPFLIRELVRHDVDVHTVERREPSLEEVFFDLTGANTAEAES